MSIFKYFLIITSISCYPLISYATNNSNLVSAQTYFDRGVMYLDGQGVPQNYPKAVELFTKAANQEFAQAQFNLGLMYYRGQGVSRNSSKAEYFIGQSCLNKHQQGCDLYRKLNQQ